MINNGLLRQLPFEIVVASQSRDGMSDNTAWRRFLSAIVLTFITSTASIAEDDTTIRVNYVYASQLGIGSYSIGGLSVKTFTLPFSVLRPWSAVFDLPPPIDHNDDWQVRLEFAPSFGDFHFKVNDPEFGKIDIRQRTFALTPGLEVIAPVNDIWALKPLARVGLGKIVTSSGRGAGDDNFFVTYTAGLRSLVEVPIGRYTAALGNGIIYAGNNELGGSDSADYWAIETGLELRRSLGFRLGDLGIGALGSADVIPEIGIFAIQYHFPDPLQFSRFREAPLEVRNQLELGLTLGSATPWTLLSFSNPRIGVSYIFGDGLDVFRINFGFPF